MGSPDILRAVRSASFCAPLVSSSLSPYATIADASSPVTWLASRRASSHGASETPASRRRHASTAPAIVIGLSAIVESALPAALRDGIAIREAPAFFVGEQGVDDDI